MRNFSLKNIFLYIYVVVKIFIIVKSPFKILLHYIKRTSPKYINTRNGITIKTSSNPHDIITFVVVFCKQDYGKVKKNSTIVDVGANIGIFSLYALSNGAKHVEIFEPCNEAYRVLFENIKINGYLSKVNMHKLAVTANDNSTVFISTVSSPYNKISLKENFSTSLEKVKTINLETALNSFKNIDLIKMDCEGAEFEIFPSLSIDFFEKIDEIRMELHGPFDEFTASIKCNSFKYLKKNINDVWLVK